MSLRAAGRWLAIVASLVAAATIGYLAGGPYGRSAVLGSFELQSLPMGSAERELAVDLPPVAPAPVRNLVLFVGDGMGVAQIEAARLAALGVEGRFVFGRFPSVALNSIQAAGTPIPESAANATALATGVVTQHKRIATDAAGRRLVTLLEAARDAGMATGLVTTSSIVDATPAAFGTHGQRGEAEALALGLATAKIDLLIGGGREAFAERGDGRDLLAEGRARGVDVRAPLPAIDPSARLPLWALAPGRFDAPGGDPPLAAWTARALDLLAAEAARRDTGYFLLVEEEGTDSAAHKNRFDALVAAVMRLDAAVAEAVGRARDGATLIVVTGDHATGGLTIDARSNASQVSVAWTSSKHSGEPVALFAYGPHDAAARLSGAYPQFEAGRRLAEILRLDLSSNWKEPR